MIITRPAILSLEIVILSFLFIFGITSQAWADSVKSIHNGANQDTMAKMDESKGAVQKKKASGRGPIRLLKNRSIRFYKGISYSDYGAIMGNARVEVNFVKSLKEKRGLPEFLNEANYSYHFSREFWKGKFLMLQEISKTKSSSESGQTGMRPHANGNKYFEEEKILAPLKLLQPKKEELLRQIFMGFHFAFTPLSGHMFLDLNATPSPEARTGIFIPF